MKITQEKSISLELKQRKYAIATRAKRRPSRRVRMRLLCRGRTSIVRTLWTSLQALLSMAFFNNVRTLVAGSQFGICNSLAANEDTRRSGGENASLPLTKLANQVDFHKTGSKICKHCL